MLSFPKNYLYLTLIFLLLINFGLWPKLIFNGQQIAAIYFINVSQGDSQLINLPPVKILIDGGPNKKIINQIGKIIPQSKYLDLVILTHPHLDHYGGLFELINNYQIGAFIYSGKDSQSQSFMKLKKKLQDQRASIITLAAGDKIIYGGNVFSILSPHQDFLRSSDFNDSSLVIQMKNQENSILFAGDIGFGIEQWLLKNYHDLSSMVLKVAHHGSKNSTHQDFLAAVQPAISIISVGANSYGHPHPETIKRLNNSGSKIYRTDQAGTVKLILSKSDFNN